MANWTLQYRGTGLTYTNVVVGPDPTQTFTQQFVLSAKKALLGAAERLNSIEGGEPALQAIKRELYNLRGYEFVGTSTTNTPTTNQQKINALAAGTVEDTGGTSPIRTSNFGVLPITVRGTALDEDRGTVTSLGVGLGYGVNEHKEWRVILV